jgi:hypothetical protein
VVLVVAGVMLLGMSWVAAGMVLLQWCMWLLLSGGSWEGLWMMIECA